MGLGNKHQLCFTLEDQFFTLFKYLPLSYLETHHLPGTEKIEAVNALCSYSLNFT